MDQITAGILWDQKGDRKVESFVEYVQLFFGRKTLTMNSTTVVVLTVYAVN